MDHGTHLTITVTYWETSLGKHLLMWWAFPFEFSDAEATDLLIVVGHPILNSMITRGLSLLFLRAGYQGSMQSCSSLSRGAHESLVHVSPANHRHKYPRSSCWNPSGESN